MILQTSLWQFVNFTCTVLSPACANWARNWYWSLPGKFLLVTPPIWRSPPIVHMKRQTPHWPWKMKPPSSSWGGEGGGGRGYHVNGPQTKAKTYWSILKTFFDGWKIPVIPTFLIDDKLLSDFKEKANRFNKFFSCQSTLFNNGSEFPSRPIFVTNEILSSD